MRLARLAAVGLAIGVIAGFAIALLRPRPQVRTGAPSNDPSGRPEVDGRREPGERREPETAAAARAGRSDDSAVLDIRTGRRVTG